MDWLLTDNGWQLYLEGFWMTTRLTVASGILALVVGTLVAVARVAPVPIMRGVGSGYVTIFRNTPLLVLILLTYYGLPEIGIDFGFFWNITLAMGLYTAAFVCEALRSGLNGVPVGQAEAARAIGMPFTRTMSQVVLPQAFRLTVPPMASAFIALAKNTSLAAVFGIAEATFRMRGFLNTYATEMLQIFLGFAFGYIVLVAVISAFATMLERRWKVVAR
ncbi:amino acid ABC transporter permease [Aeromicrobium choanae]|uniref:Glutamate transport system permease protein n=1 Tax=Aeromicrobium choanae TaxID=1736691 RepID=A0A1T4YPJ1_9ACTN|nr:amino acid ABC transporter permease [Aeromicrobium choanae]SKB03185.1 glutamate transport system permease protein [Aeromicrobium choanae]